MDLAPIVTLDGGRQPRLNWSRQDISLNTHAGKSGEMDGLKK
jgi:hypothetical protein